MGNTAAFGGGLPPGISGTNDRCTVLVSNLNPERVDEDKLFNLFFEMNGKKQALVLFENEEQATEALVCKHATSLGGSTIRISFSQLQTI
ncbi:hypothetical protein ACS0TY_031617 [Phlomoides rotata]